MRGREQPQDYPCFEDLSIEVARHEVKKMLDSGELIIPYVAGGTL